MAVINDAAEDSALFDYMRSQGHASAYFGFSDATNEGTWSWVNGEWDSLDSLTLNNFAADLLTDDTTKLLSNVTFAQP